MGMRLLTKHFGAYTISKFEKEQSKIQGHEVTIMDFIDIGNLSVDKMLFLIRMGTNNCTGEEAGEKLDNFMAGGNGLIDAYLQLLDELDRDVHIFKGTGISINDIKEQMYKDLGNKSSDEKHKIVEFKQDETKDETVLKDEETPKVDVNGFVSLDETNSDC